MNNLEITWRELSRSLLINFKLFKVLVGSRKDVCFVAYNKHVKMLGGSFDDCPCFETIMLEYARNLNLVAT